MARGDELILPVSFLFTRLNVVARLQLPPLKGCIQQQLAKPIVILSSVSIVSAVKLNGKRCSPKDQFSSVLKCDKRKAFVK